MNLYDLLRNQASRRSFLGQASCGVGSVALASLFGPKLFAESKEASAAKWPGVINPLHHPAKVKRVIFLYMAGGASHLETFDYKPKLAEMNGKPMPASFTQGQPIAQLQGQKLNCLGPQHPFKKCGKSGQEISTIFPRLAEVADDLCIIRSLKTEAINHDPAHTFMNAGTLISGRPSMGSWLWYGLSPSESGQPARLSSSSPRRARRGSNSAADRATAVA